VAGHGVTVVEMTCGLAREVNRSAGIKAHSERAARVKGLDLAQLAVGDLPNLIRRRQLHPIADGEGAFGVALDRDALSAPRVVPPLASPLPRHHETLILAHLLDTRVLSGAKAIRAAAPRIPHDVARRVLGSPLAIRAGEI